MLTFSLNKTPPTPAEIDKEGTKIYWAWARMFGLYALLILTEACANSKISLPSADYNLAISEVRDWLNYYYPVRVFILCVFLLQFFLNLFNFKYWQSLCTISKSDRAEIAKGLDQPIVAEYCAKVSAQGRELMEGEKSAIARHIRKKESQAWSGSSDWV